MPPPPASAISKVTLSPTSSTRLPVSFDRLIGREADLERAERGFRQAFERLLTIVGPGGSGKTRFAVEFAKRLEGGFLDGAAFVDLSTVYDAASLLPEMARVLAVDTPEAKLQDMLEGKDLLLVLDNLEQIVGAGSEVRTLLERFPGLHLLVTSRIPLNIPGERRFPLRPLSFEGSVQSPSTAVQLLLERAGAVGADWHMDNKAAYNTLVRLCQRLDGLPLALELVAARSALYSPESVLAQLERGATLGARGRVARHRDLGALLDWSVALLVPSQRRALECLAVMAGSFDVSAAAAMIGSTEGQTLEALEEMTECGLMVALPDVEPRFRLLETVRTYALEAGGTGSDAMRERHAHFYTERAQRLAGNAKGLNAVDQEYPQYRVAMRWLVDVPEPWAVEVACHLAEALSAYWQRRHLLDDTPLLKRLLERISPSESLWVKIGLIGVILGFLAGEFSDILPLAQAVSAQAKRSEDLLDYAKAVHAQALIQSNLGGLSEDNLSDIEDVLQRLNRSPESVESLSCHAALLDVRATEYAFRQDFEAALACHETEVVVSRKTHNPFDLARTLTNLALIRFIVKRDRACLELLEEGLACAIQAEDTGITLLNYLSSAEIALYFGQLETARDHAQRSVEVLATVNKPVWGWRAQFVLSKLTLMQADTEHGWQVACQDIRDAVNLGQGVYLWMAALNLADLTLARGLEAQARRWLRFAQHPVRNHNPDHILPVVVYLRLLHAEQFKILESRLGIPDLDAAPDPTLENPEQALEWLEQQSPAETAPEVEPTKTRGVQTEAHKTPEPVPEATLNSVLSSREREVLGLLAQGLTDKRIAATLELSPSTVNTHLKKLFIKLEVRTRAQAVGRANELGLL
jgi:predicted ATPase/DNA-binding CsgD family transcriptional regulator